MRTEKEIREKIAALVDKWGRLDAENTRAFLAGKRSVSSSFVDDISNRRFLHQANILRRVLGEEEPNERG